MEGNVISKYVHKEKDYAHFGDLYLWVEFEKSVSYSRDTWSLREGVVTHIDKAWLVCNTRRSS